MLGAVPLPGIGVPVSVLPAMIALPLRRPINGPPMARGIAIWLLVGTLAWTVISLTNGVIPGANVAQFAVVALLLLAYLSTITSLESAATLVGWTSLSMTVYTVAFGAGNTRGSFEDLWKYGIAFTFTIFTLYLLARTDSAVAGIIALIILGTFGTVLNYRSFGLVCGIAAAICIAKLGTGRHIALRIATAGGILALLAVLLPQALSSGVFGATVQAKTVAQTEAGGPLLLGGRTEPPLSIAAITERPFGWGSAQLINADTLNRGSEIARFLGVTEVEQATKIWVRADGYVSLHSMLFVPWVEGGIVAAIPMLLFIALFGWAAAVSRGRWTVLVTLVAAQSIWDILFSPWTGERAVALAAAAILAAWTIAMVTSQTATIRLGPGRGADRFHLEEA